jgi:Bacterial capsule synthesis protein PGA_cap
VADNHEVTRRLLDSLFHRRDRVFRRKAPRLLRLETKMSMASNSITIGAVGDIAAFHKDPDSMFDYVLPDLTDVDVSFVQPERHYNDSTVTPVGSFTEQVPPEKALAKSGFDIVSSASNHCMDLGEEPMMQTVGALKECGFDVIGVGRTIAEARRPGIIERNGVTVAFLAYCSVLRPNYEADVHKAGAAPMRAFTLYHQHDYQPGTPPHIKTYPHEDDLNEIIADITRVRSAVDIVVASFHWGVHFVDSVIADYQKVVAHPAIDAGADIIIGHHPHMLKGIEVHQGKPIFYSLGNFAFDLPSDVVAEWHRKMPYEKAAYDRQGWVYNEPEWSAYTFPPACRLSMMSRFLVTGTQVTKAALHTCDDQ